MTAPEIKKDWQQKHRRTFKASLPVSEATAEGFHLTLPKLDDVSISPTKYLSTTQGAGSSVILFSFIYTRSMPKNGVQIEARELSRLERITEVTFPHAQAYGRQHYAVCPLLHTV